MRRWGETGGHGTWEIAARYSYLNLNDGPIDGGRINDVTLGLNWYLNQYTKMQFNVTVHGVETDFGGFLGLVLSFCDG